MADIKDVFDKFKEDDLVGAKADLAPMIRKVLNDRIKEKLNLKENPIEDVEDAEDEDFNEE